MIDFPSPVYNNLVFLRCRENTKFVAATSAHFTKVIPTFNNKFLGHSCVFKILEPAYIVTVEINALCLLGHKV